MALAGIDAASDGLRSAAGLGVATTHEGIDGLRALPCWREIGIVFDACRRVADRDLRMPPPPARIAGSLSIMLWTAVIFGRWVGFST